LKHLIKNRPKLRGAGFLSNDPTNQGLKLVFVSAIFYITIFLSNNPTNQGLKHAILEKYDYVVNKFLSNNPTNQGLKPILIIPYSE